MHALPQPSERALRAGFGALALIHLGLGAWLFFSPRSFFTTIGAFGSYNRHYERDTATFYFAFALGCAVAARRAGWRLPVIAIVTLQYTLHTINHAIDAGVANNAWAGGVDVVSLGLATIQLSVLLWLLAQRSAEARRV